MLTRGKSISSTQRADSLTEKNNIIFISEKLTKRREKKVMPRTLSQPELEPNQNAVRIEFQKNETVIPNNPQAMSPSGLRPPKL